MIIHMILMNFNLMEDYFDSYHLAPLPAGPFELLTQMMNSVMLSDLLKEYSYKYSKFPILDDELLEKFMDPSEQKNKI